MSGGYFDYEDNRLLDFAQKIENEIRCNNNDEKTYDEDLCMTIPAGLHAADVTLFLMRKIVEDCDKLAKLLHEFDWYVCGDTYSQVGKALTKICRENGWEIRKTESSDNQPFNVYPIKAVDLLKKRLDADKNMLNKWRKQNDCA